MGRGLSDQQRRILAVAAAINAHRNGGEPRLAEIELDVRKGTPRAAIPMPGGFSPLQPDPTNYRYVCARAEVDLIDDFLLVHLGGFRPGRRETVWIDAVEKRCPTPTADRREGRLNRRTYVAPGYQRTIRRRWDPETINHKRRVSIARAAESLLARELLVFAPSPGYFAGWGSPCDEAGKRLAADIEQDFKSRPGSVSRGYYLTAEGLAAAGGRWQELDVLELVEHWETARSVR